ncbi:MAG: O-antigen ligase family protein, partial [Chlorobium sp.]|nr:O-antigen ligase family protein [Chlorobium sp.]
LVIEHPWQSVRYLNDIPIERPFAIFMIVVAFFSGKFRIVSSPTNKWVYSLLALHFLLAPFAFSVEYAIDQSVEYAKMVSLYLLMLSVAEDEEALKMLVKAYVFSMLFFMFHSLWEYSNGRHEWRMGISRMVGADFTDPNAFGASVVLSIPFVYVLFCIKPSAWVKRLLFCYFPIAVICVVLTGSRTSFVALIFLLALWVIQKKGSRKIVLLVVASLAVCFLWASMPVEKQDRIRTLWDKDAGPANAQQSAQGRLQGFKVSWEMFKREPLTGVGVGGKNFIGYRMAHEIDDVGHESPTQAHVLYGQVLAEQGVFGGILFCGLVVSVMRSAIVVWRTKNGEDNFYSLMSRAILASLLLLLLLGFGGHNFYRPLWLWLAAWSGAMLGLVKRQGKTVIYAE